MQPFCSKGYGIVFLKTDAVGHEALLVLAELLAGMKNSPIK